MFLDTLCFRTPLFFTKIINFSVITPCRLTSGSYFSYFSYFLIQIPTFPYFLRKQPYYPYFLGCHFVKLNEEHLKLVFLH